MASGQEPPASHTCPSSLTSITQVAGADLMLYPNASRFFMQIQPAADSRPRQDAHALNCIQQEEQTLQHHWTAEPVVLGRRVSSSSSSDWSRCLLHHLCILLLLTGGPTNGLAGHFRSRCAAPAAHCHRLPNLQADPAGTAASRFDICLTLHKETPPLWRKPNPRLSHQSQACWPCLGQQQPTRSTHHPCTCCGPTNPSPVVVPPPSQCSSLSQRSWQQFNGSRSSRNSSYFVRLFMLLLSSFMSTLYCFTFAKLNRESWSSRRRRLERVVPRGHVNLTSGPLFSNAEWPEAGQHWASHSGQQGRNQAGHTALRQEDLCREEMTASFCWSNVLFSTWRPTLLCLARLL